WTNGPGPTMSIICCLSTASRASNTLPTAVEYKGLVPPTLEFNLTDWEGGVAFARYMARSPTLTAKWAVSFISETIDSRMGCTNFVMGLVWIPNAAASKNRLETA